MRRILAARMKRFSLKMSPCRLASTAIIAPVPDKQITMEEAAMKRVLAAIAVVLASPITLAANATLTYSNLHFEVVDLDTGDGIDATASGVPLGSSITWVDALDTYHPLDGKNEIPVVVEWTGMLGPKSQIHWDMDTAIHASIVDDMFSSEFVDIEFMSYGFFRDEFFDGFTQSGIEPVHLSGFTGNNQTLSFHSLEHIGAFLSNPLDIAVPFTIGIGTDFAVVGLPRPPIPEPDTSVLILCGLAVLALARRAFNFATAPQVTARPALPRR